MSYGPLKVRCANCKSKIIVKAKNLHRPVKVECPRCGTLIVISKKKNGKFALRFKYC